MTGIFQWILKIKMDSVPEYCNRFYLGGRKDTVRLKLYWVKMQQWFVSWETGFLGVFVVWAALLVHLW